MDKPTGTIYTHIERDNQNRWHPVIVIKYRGTQTFAATGLQGYMTRVQAEKAGQQEANRLAKGRPVV